MLAVVFGIATWAAIPAPVAARVFIGFGVPFPGFWPYYGYPPPAYYYPPPPPPYYYPPPMPAYFPAPIPGAAPAPTAGAAPTPAAATITYTSKPAFTNAAGQTCREYTTTQNVGGQSKQVFGTACQDATGQWRIAN
jgi:hypothetical protein